MANLFPTLSSNPEAGQSVAREVNFGQSWIFDFDQGDFVLTPTGKAVECQEEEAWVQWCIKALHTQRYRYLVYSRNYGQEFEDLISLNLTRNGNESEIGRMTEETLRVDPRTAEVGHFQFDWSGGKCDFRCEIRSIRGRQATLTGSVVMG